MEFPEHQVLSRAEVEPMLDKLAAAVGASPDDPVPFAHKCLAAARLLPDVNAESDDFSFVGLIEGLDLDPESTVYLNWHWWEETLCMKLADLCSVFDYIWFPSSDDLSIVSSDVHWLMEVEHHGAISFVRWR